MMNIVRDKHSKCLRINGEGGNSHKLISLLLLLLSFGFYIIACYYYITKPSLWIDESVEYWYSKILTGKLPFNGFNCANTQNMYERILSTFQPPLYNVMVYFWLLLRDSELWFRSFSCLQGLFGIVGIFACSLRLTDSRVFSSAAALATTAVYGLIYYWTEASEYCLVITFVTWMIYCFIRLQEEFRKKWLFLYCVFAILAIYSQYGAAFPILVLSLQILLSERQKEHGKFVLAIFGTVLIVAGAPLLYFFALPQIQNQTLAYGETGARSILDAFLGFPVGVIRIFKYNFNLNVVLAVLATIAFSGLWFYNLKICKKNGRIVAITLVIILIMYYCVTAIGLYAGFGGRHGVFLLPFIWLVAINGLFGVLDAVNQKKKLLILSLVLLLCITSFIHNMKSGWEKEDIRSITNRWYEVEQEQNEQIPTFVYYAADSGFLFYLRHNEQYQPELENKIYLMDWQRNQTKDTYQGIICSLYGNEYPNEILFVGQHDQVDDMKDVLSAFEKNGYLAKPLLERKGACLIRLARSFNQS